MKRFRSSLQLINPAACCQGIYMDVDFSASDLESEGLKVAVTFLPLRALSACIKHLCGTLYG